ncbi:MAG: hypothetical protein WC333_02795 [Dehalococcoidia bacterium]|jgi:hypothetical protein
MSQIPVEYTRGNNHFLLGGVPSAYTLLDFWSWAFSDVLNNTTRGIVAEFVVATALGIDVKKPRVEWSSFDLTYRNHGIEVKSSAYHQRWHQDRLTSISFTIKKHKGYDADTNKSGQVSQRHADIYVLSLLAEKDRDKVNPLDFDQWGFWVVSSRFFDDRKRSQDSIYYNSLIKEIGEPISYGTLRAAVDNCIDKGV